MSRILSGKKQDGVEYKISMRKLQMQAETFFSFLLLSIYRARENSAIESEASYILNMLSFTDIFHIFNPKKQKTLSFNFSESQTSAAPSKKTKTNILQAVAVSNYIKKRLRASLAREGALHEFILSRIEKEDICNAEKTRNLEKHRSELIKIFNREVLDAFDEIKNSNVIEEIVENITTEFFRKQSSAGSLLSSDRHSVSSKTLSSGSKRSPSRTQTATSLHTSPINKTKECSKNRTEKAAENKTANASHYVSECNNNSLSSYQDLYFEMKESAENEFILKTLLSSAQEDAFSDSVIFYVLVIAAVFLFLILVGICVVIAILLLRAPSPTKHCNCS
ncbi:hypothetical protein NEMIN01_0436 [Nematocida minor]|uniref:uncharacterized protein n=1 Tax=Nematocida minor TaxID=1912983 RepID=UPI00221F611C|nr:uncharacterized protein NEMIN01_0436 [Nematocida minor]KAI5189373.1 hypothetical protein NEMIN01_0436 [Nematocida minor]